MLTIFVGGGFLKRPSINAIFVDSEGQEKVTFSQVSSFSVSIFVTFSCNVVGQALDNVDFVVNIEENSCHLKFPVLTLDQDWGGFLKRASMDE